MVKVDWQRGRIWKQVGEGICLWVCLWRMIVMTLIGEGGLMHWLGSWSVSTKGT